MTAVAPLSPGVWSLPQIERTVAVAIDELPEDPSTVWLRLLGRGRVQERAIVELEARFGRDELVHATLALLLAWRQQAPAEGEGFEEDAMNPHLQQVYNRLEKKLRAEGKAEGKVEGLREGEAKGKAEGKAEALLMLLSGRGLRVTSAQEARVRACTDLGQLDAWFQAALTTTSVAALLAPPARRQGSTRAKTARQ